MIDQVLISVIILATLGFFIWGKWRYDVIALIALFSVAILGLVSFDDVFLGFVHPVVILVVAMLIISKGLINSGAIDFVINYFKFTGRHPIVQLAILLVFTTFLSAFINSLGALAFVIPIAVKVARQNKTPLSLFLIPLAFGSHFGGGITLIGSVSNIIISGFRAEKMEAFAFFDFAPVALPIAVVSILFVVFIGWRILPKREDVFSQSLTLKSYLAEVKVVEKSSVLGKTIKEFQSLSKENLVVLALVRQDEYISEPSPSFVIQKDDILVIETETMFLESLLTTAKLDLVFKRPFKENEKDTKSLEVAEVVVSESSFLAGETAKSFKFHQDYQVNLLALHRSGSKIKKRLGDVRLRPGDVLVVQGESEKLGQFSRFFNLFPLKEKEFYFEGKKEKALLASGIFLLAILLSVFEVFPVHFIFALAAIAVIIVGLLPPKKTYDSVDFSMIILIAVMLQLGSVFYQTGAASSLAGALFSFEGISPEIALAVILLASILLSDLLSNVTVAALLAPVAFALSQHFGVSPDPFLMAVAIGSGSSYLTPIGHQSNIFVMSIGGYRFGDYWRLGLPLEIITFVLGFFLILHFWPF